MLILIYPVRNSGVVHTVILNSYGNTSTKRFPIRAYSHRASAEVKAKILFHVCSLYFDLFCLLSDLFCFWSHFFLGVNRSITLQLLRPFSQLRDCKPLYMSVEPAKTSTHHIRDIKVAKVSVPLQNPQLFTDGCGTTHSLCRVWSDSVNGIALTCREIYTSDWHTSISLLKGTVPVPILKKILRLCPKFNNIAIVSLSTMV